MTGARSVPDLLRRVAEARVRVREFNPVSLLIRREMDLSRLLGWLLEPNGGHRLGAMPLDGFLALVDVHGVDDADRCRVALEVPRYAGDGIAGRIDIELVHRRFEVLVENKPFAGFGDRQLERYAETLPVDGRTGRVVALLGRGWNESALRGLERHTGAMALRLGVEIRDWVFGCARSAPAGRVRDLLIAFGEDLDERHGGMGAALTAGIVEDAMSTPESVAAAVSISQAFSAVADRMTLDFAARVARRLADGNVGRLRTLDGDRPLFGANKDGVLRIDIGFEGFDVVLAADGTFFSRVFVGVRAVRETPRIETLRADEVAKLFAALGGSSEDNLWNRFLWWRWIGEIGPVAAAPRDGPANWAWAADDTDDGLAALFVAKAAEVRAALGL